MRIGSASGIAGHGEFSLICPVPDGETLPFEIIALNTSDATRIQSRVYVCYLTYQKLFSIWSFKYKTTVVVRIM